MRKSKDNQNVCEAMVDSITENDTFTCGYCQEIFTSELGLKQHLKRSHAENQKSFECDFCDKTFKSSTGLVIHKRHSHVESQNKNGFQCELCTLIHSKCSPGVFFAS